MRQELNLLELLSDLAHAELEFIVIGSSALAIQGWEIAPEDLDLMTRPAQVDALRSALDIHPEHCRWVTDGMARRLECMTSKGPVDIYVEVSGALTYEDVDREATLVSVGKDGLNVKAGSFEHVRDMRAAVGRDPLPASATAPGAMRGKPRVIAIDGPAGAGKSTVTRSLAREIGFTYLDTGAMYRCVTLAVFARRADTDDPTTIGQIADSIEIRFEGEKVFLDDSDVTAAIRTSDITEATPHIASYPEVRRAMVKQQQHLFTEGGYVAEGRDITTVVAPDAPLKVYLTASPEERARRRAQETGETYATVLAALHKRDRLDSAREHSALRIAEDAVVVDTTGRSVEEVVAEIATLARNRGIV